MYFLLPLGNGPSLAPPAPPAPAPAPGYMSPGPPAPLWCMDCLRWSMASCGDIGGNGTPLFGGRPGLELRSKSKLFFIRKDSGVSSGKGRGESIEEER